MKLLKSVVRKALALTGREIIKVNKIGRREIYNAYYMGGCLKCIKGDPLTEDILSGKGWDTQIPTILNSLDSDGKILEIGANIGASILPHANKFPNRKFYLAEPVPDFFKILEQNHKTYNSSNNVEIANLAFGQRHGESIEICVGLGTAGKSRLVHYQMQDTTLKIQATTIDEVFSHDKIVLIKIDVDGHELGVLKGGEKVLRLQNPKLFLEFAPRVMQDIGQAPEDIAAFLRMVGFNHIDIWDHDANFLKSTNDWADVLDLGIKAPHYLNILASKVKGAQS